jgi:hypothetical protein
VQQEQLNLQDTFEPDKYCSHHPACAITQLSARGALAALHYAAGCSSQAAADKLMAANKPTQSMPSKILLCEVMPSDGWPC